MELDELVGNIRTARDQALEDRDRYWRAREELADQRNMEAAGDRVRLATLAISANSVAEALARILGEPHTRSDVIPRTDSLGNPLS